MFVLIHTAQALFVVYIVYKQLNIKSNIYDCWGKCELSVVVTAPLIEILIAFSFFAMLLVIVNNNRSDLLGSRCYMVSLKLDNMYYISNQIYDLYRPIDKCQNFEDYFEFNGVKHYKTRFKGINQLLINRYGDVDKLSQELKESRIDIYCERADVSISKISTNFWK